MKLTGRGPDGILQRRCERRGSWAARPLKSWLTITGKTRAASKRGLRLKFNTVTDYLFLPIGSPGCAVRGLRQTHSSMKPSRPSLTIWHTTLHKFMNVAKKCILPGEEVIGVVMQAELRTPVMTLFGHAYPLLKAPAHILVRTDHELIVAVEEKQEACSGSHKYGSTPAPTSRWRNLPRSISQPVPHTRAMSIHLLGGETNRPGLCSGAGARPAPARGRADLRVMRRKGTRVPRAPVRRRPRLHSSLKSSRL